MSACELPDREPWKSARPTSTRYQVVALLCAAAIIAYLSRNCLSVAQGKISEELSIPLVPMGWVMGTFFWSYALGQIPAGWLGHVWGSRGALAVYAAVWSLACGAMGLASGFWMLVAVQFVFGLGQAGLFPCAAAVISHWLPASRRAMSSGLLAGSQSLGGALGSALTGGLLAGVLFGLQIPAWTWRGVYALYALPGLLWAVLFLIWFRDRPTEHRRVNQAELAIIAAAVAQRPSDADRTGTPWSAVVSSLDMWLIFGQQFFRAAGYIFFATWFPKFLQETRGVSLEAAGALTALPLLAVVAGSPSGGLVVDYLWNRTGSRRLSRQVVAVGAMLVSAACIAAAYFIADAVPAVLVISAGSFAAGFGGSCGYTVTIEKAGRHVAPIFGAMNMCGNIGAAICPVVVAWIAERTGQWNLVLLFFVAVYLGAAGCWSLLNPEGAVDEQPPRLATKALPP